MASDGFAALLSNRRYALYLLSRVSFIVATQMLSVAVGWQVYEITRRALALGFSGLALFLPAFLLALPGGQLADRHDRRRIILVCHVGVAASAVVLALLARGRVQTLAPIYAVLVVIGTIRAFSGPAGQALMPSLVPREQLQRGVAFSSSVWQLAMIVGPSLGGVIYAATARAETVYEASAVLALVAAACVIAMGDAPPSPGTATASTRPPASLDTLFAGIRYVWSNKAIFGSISLDLFAVLLGGAVALLPIYARDILRVGPWGLGLLRSAPAVGAALIALLLTWVPVRRRAGPMMFAGVAIFGVGTIVFGVSRSFVLSLVALVVLGAADMLSVVIRSTLIQTRTPDEMRGRVGAVNLVFAGASNELGEFESGVTAAWLGPEVAVVAGGLGTLVVVVAWLVLFRELRQVDRIEED